MSFQTSKIRTQNHEILTTEFSERIIQRNKPNLQTKAADVLLVFLTWKFEERGPTYHTFVIRTPKMMSSKLLHSFRFFCKTKLREDNHTVQFVHFAVFPREKKEWILEDNIDKEREEFVCL